MTAPRSENFGALLLLICGALEQHLLTYYAYEENLQRYISVWG